MGKHTIDTRHPDGLEVTVGGDTWIVMRSGSITSSSGAAITDRSEGSTFEINGAVIGAGTGLNTEQAQDTTVKIGTDGVVYGAQNAISLGAYSTLLNSGRVYGRTSIAAHDRVENSGLLSGGVAISISGTLINNGYGTIQAEGLFVVADSSAGETIRIVNDGKFMGVQPGDTLIFGGPGRELVTNRHDISGTINLAGDNDQFTSHDVTIQGRILGGDGNDRIDVRGCTIKAFGDELDGGVYGGLGDDVLDLRGAHLANGAYGTVGNDTYIIDSRSIHISENLDNDGIDSVESYVSYVLHKNFENLALKGSKDLDASGNGLANDLSGNTGDNTLEGLGGRDALDGGKGNDVLIGGAGADTFGFASHYGKDEIMDFHANEGDVIYVHNWQGINNLGDVKSHATDHGNNVWIAVGQDTLVIDHMHMADLAGADFHF